MNDFIIRDYSPKDREKIFELLDTVWGHSFVEKLKEIWFWKIEKNPFIESEMSVGTVIEKNNKIIGFISKMPAPLKFYQKKIEGIWLGDYVVHPDHRGLGHKLLSYTMKDTTLMLGEPNDLSYNVSKKLGFLDIYTPENRICIVNLNNILKNKKIGPDFFQKCCGKIWDGMNSFIKMMALKKNREISIERITRFDDRIDTLWRSIKDDYKIAVIRNKEYLNWRYIDRPDAKYNIYLVKDTHTILGYAVTRTQTDRGLKFGHIVDFCFDLKRKDAFSLLIFSVISDFANINKVDLITCYIQPNHPFYKKVLKKYGFF